MNTSLGTGFKMYLKLSKSYPVAKTNTMVCVCIKQDVKVTYNWFIYNMKHFSLENLSGK